MHKRRWITNSILSVCLASASTFGHAKATGTRGFPGKQVGVASYYSDKLQGRRTANGERYNKEKLTADHPSLPFGTVLRVVNLNNRRSVEVRINDRTRLPRGRILDLSRRAARELGMLDTGLTKVAIEVVGKDS